MNWLAVLAALSVTACSDGERLSLKGTDLTVVTPRGFVHHSSVYTMHPHLEFVLEPDRIGNYSEWPSMTLEEVSARTPPVTLDHLKARHRNVEEDNWIVRPRDSTAAGIPAYEFAYEFDAGCPHGCAPNEHGPRLAIHAFVFTHEERLYNCELVVHVGGYALVRRRFQGFCESIHFASREIA